MIFEALVEKRASTNLGTALANPTSWLSQWFSGGSPDSASGITVSETAAINLTAVYAAVNVLAKSVSSLPLKVYRVDGRGKSEARDHPLYPVLKSAPNRHQTSAVFRKTMQGDALLWGNGYAEIERNGAGAAIGLHRRHPSRVTPQWVGGEIVYRVTNTDRVDSLIPADDFLHIPNFSIDGIQGVSPIQAHREALGLAAATERFGGAFFGNGSWFGGFIKHPGSINKEAADRLRAGIEGGHKGVDKAHKFVVLDEGMDFTPAGVPPEDAQFLETRQFQVTEVARMFGIPPHKIADLTHATFTNIEHQALEYLTDSLLPWLRVWEQEFGRKLFAGTDLFAEFVVDGMLRGDFQTRTDGYVKLIQNGIMSRNEVRAKENLNPVDGGDEYMVPMNMSILDEDGKPVLPEQQPGSLLPVRSEQRSAAELRTSRSIDNRRALRETFIGLLEDAIGRLVTREAQDIANQVKRLPEIGTVEFRQWVLGFYEKHEAFTMSVLAPILAALLRAAAIEAAGEVKLAEDKLEARLNEFTEEYNAAAAKRYVGSHRNQLLDLIDDVAPVEEQVEAITERLEGWQEGAARKVAGIEATQAIGAVSMMMYAASGVRLMRWNAGSDACPLCQRMHGKIVEVSQPFLTKGDQVDPDGDTAPFNIKKVVRHPPLHGGCDCNVSAEGV